VVLIPLALLGNSATLTKAFRLAITGLILCLPAMLWTDPGGSLTGFVWVVTISAAMYTAIGRIPDSLPNRAVCGLLLASFASAAFLVAAVLPPRCLWSTC